MQLECSICLELLCEPQELPCSHVFCRRCLASCLQHSRRCALCRESIDESFDPVSFPVSKRLEQRLMRQCTMEYTQRLQDVASAAAQIVQLHISNSYELVSISPRVKHGWTLKVDLEALPECCLPHNAALPGLIKNVRFGLKPAFRVLRISSESCQPAQTPAYVDATCQPFQVTATSHVATAVPIIVTWQDWVGQPPLRLDHQLSFKYEGGSQDYAVDLRTAFTGSADGSNPVMLAEPAHTMETLPEPAELQQPSQARSPSRKSSNPLSLAWTSAAQHLASIRLPSRRPWAHAV